MNSLDQVPGGIEVGLDQLVSYSPSDRKDIFLRAVTDLQLRHHILRFRDQDAKDLGAMLQGCLTSMSDNDPQHPLLLRLLQDLCSESKVLPATYWLSDVKIKWKCTIGRGGEAIVRPGTWNGEQVAVREIMIPTDSLPNHSTTLEHENILRLLGVYQDDENDMPMMVLPLQKGGILKYLAAIIASETVTPDICFEAIHKLLVGMARAVAYLHGRGPPVIHGDLHPENVLVGSDGEAIICDFGLSRIRHTITRTHTAIQSGGRARFIAPDLSAGPEKFRTSPTSDIYSLAMTFVNMLTLSIPLAEIPRDLDALRAIETGVRPECPSILPFQLPDPFVRDLWTLLDSMWRSNTSQRPTALKVRDYLEALTERGYSGRVDPYNLFCKNLDLSIDSHDLFNLFKPYGQIVSARVMRGDNGVSRGFGFVSYQQPDQASIALQSMNGTTIKNKQIQVRIHEPKQLRQEKLAKQFAEAGQFGQRRTSGNTSPAISDGGAEGLPDRTRRGSGSYYNAALTGSLNLARSYEELQSLSPVVRNDVLKGVLHRRVRALERVPAIHMDAVVDAIIALPFSELVQGLHDTDIFNVQVKLALDLAEQNFAQRNPSSNGNGLSLSSLSLGSNPSNTETTASTTVPDNASVRNVSTPPPPSGAATPSSEQDRLIIAVNKLGTETGSVTDIVDLLLTLPKKERALCLFNTEYLKSKVADAREVLLY